jgi:hypothetical protein
MDEFYIGQKFEGEYPPEAAVWCNENNAHIEDQDGQFVIVENPAPVITVADYDATLEQHIFDTRAARGYTTREPSYYLQSSVPRWKQDALDWVAFVDECMLYGLDIQNRYAAGEEVPSLEEFKANLPRIVWTYSEVV